MHQKARKFGSINFLSSKNERDSFISHHWNQKPMQIKNAWTRPFTLSEQLIDELLLNNEVESRAVKNKIKRKMYHGPFERAEIARLKEKDFTFIIHNLNLFFSEFASLEKRISFINNYEFDDIMCTFSNKGMSLGAHYDPYNVFILQAKGKRKWQLQKTPKNQRKLTQQDDAEQECDEWCEDEEIKVLKHFAPDMEFILNEGDLLYIPPFYSHCGTTLSETSLSYSIGFKAIEIDQLAKNYLIKSLDKFCERVIFKTNGDEGHAYPENLTMQFREYLIKNLCSKDEIQKFLMTNLSVSKSDTEYDQEDEYEEEGIDDLETCGQVSLDHGEIFNKSYSKNPYARYCYRSEDATEFVDATESEDAAEENMTLGNKLKKETSCKIILSISMKTYTLTIEEFSYIKNYLEASHFEDIQFAKSKILTDWSFLERLIQDNIFIESEKISYE